MEGLFDHGGAMMGISGPQGRMQPAPRCCLTLPCLLLSAPTNYTPRQGPSCTHVPFCGSTLDLALMQPKSSVSSSPLQLFIPCADCPSPEVPTLPTWPRYSWAGLKGAWAPGLTHLGLPLNCLQGVLPLHSPPVCTLVGSMDVLEMSASL